MLTLLLFIFLHFSPQGPTEKNLTNHPGQDRYASYSPDGTKIIFESDRAGHWDIYLMNRDGSGLARLTRDTADDRRPSWHPAGDKILFESDRTGSYQLYSLEIKDQRLEFLNIPEMRGTPIFACYSFDGSSIAYSLKYEGDSSKLVIVDASGRLEAELADFGFRSFYPRWSPDDKKLLFFSRHETNNSDDEIYELSIDGSMKKRLTNWPKHNFCPAWSGDGKRIAYAQSMHNSRPEIFIMNADGTGSQRITYNEDGDTLPNWSPDGTTLLITAYRNGNYEIVELAIPGN